HAGPTARLTVASVQTDPAHATLPLLFDGDLGATGRQVIPFTVTDDGRLEARLRPDVPGLVLELLTAAGSPLLRSDGGPAGEPPAIELDLAAGDYLLAVSGPAGAYRLAASLRPGP